LRGVSRDTTKDADLVFILDDRPFEFYHDPGLSAPIFIFTDS
jgi:hypothetical protein